MFIAGTQPVEACRLHGGGGRTQVAGWEPTASPVPITTLVPSPVVTAKAETPKRAPRSILITPESSDKPAAEGRKGFWHRVGDFLHGK